MVHYGSRFTIKFFFGSFLTFSQISLHLSNNSSSHSKYNLFRMYYGFYTHIDAYPYSTIYIYVHMVYDTWHIHMTYDLLIFVIMLNVLRFKSSILFGTHALLDEPLRVLQLPAPLSNLTANGWYWNSWLYSLGCKLKRVGWISHF